MSKKTKPLKVIVVNPPSKEHAKELIEKINEMFKIKYSDSNKLNENKTTKK